MRQNNTHFFRHSMMAWHRGHRPSVVPSSPRIFLVFLDFGLCRNANSFWCLGAPLGLLLEDM